MEKIPFMDISRQYKAIKDEVGIAINRVFESGAFSGGPFVEAFENDFARYCNAQYAVAVNSGTSAIHLALAAIGIKEGDEVVVPANTFIATPLGASYLKATPVFVDCDPKTWNIDPEKVEEKITDKTKAVIGVHLFGQPCAIAPLMDICKAHGLLFVEDAAQAHGARYNGKRVGTFGKVACFSFYPGKNLGSYGEGGAVTTASF